LSSAGTHGLLLLRTAPERRSTTLGLDAVLKKLDLARPCSIDVALKLLGLSTGYRIDLRIVTLSTRGREVNIDGILKALSLSELYEIDLALQKLTLTRNYQNDVLIVLRSIVSLAIDAVFRKLCSAPHGIDVSISLIPKMPRCVGIGVYLLNQQKFDLAVSFEQFEVNPSFECLSVVSSFESFEVTPFFQEV